MQARIRLSLLIGGGGGKPELFLPSAVARIPARGYNQKGAKRNSSLVAAGGNMERKRLQVGRRQARAGVIICLAGGILGVAFGAAAAQSNPAARPGGAPLTVPAQDQTIPPGPEINSLPGLSSQQKRSLLKERFDKTKQQAAELVKLAQALQNDLNQSSENVLSVHVVEKAEKIEKLAKKIKNEARGY